MLEEYVTGYAEKGTERQPSLRLREFRENFAKIGQPYSFENLKERNRVSLSFCRIFLRLLLSEKECIYLLIMKKYGDKKFGNIYIKKHVIFSMQLLMRESQFQNRQL